MGNSKSKSKLSQNDEYETKQENRFLYINNISLPNFASTLSALSGRSFGSAFSHQSTYSVSRPWSRVSRKRWNQSTLNNPLEASKTAWPVPYIEALFLPEFKIKPDVSEMDFKILEPLAGGAFGQVYKVIKKDSEEVFALKILSKSQIIADKAINQVKDEVKIQSICGHHPFIVNCFYYWQNRKQIFLVSEYLPGGELLKICQDYGPLPEIITKIYVAEIALAIDFLHSAGVIYRDLKLENILLDALGHIKLIDFGLAKWLKYGSRTTTICGTKQYMAPEILCHEPYTHYVDWWSLGIVTSIMLTSQYIPDNAVLPEWTSEVAASVAARDLLRRLLQPDPAIRLHSLLALENIAFFKDFSMADIRAKKINMMDLYAEHFPNGPQVNRKNEEETRNQDFKDFDSIVLDDVREGKKP